MNTPSYIIQRNNQTVVNLRPIHERMGFTPSEFPNWFKDRIRKMNLIEGKDFEKYSENRYYQYVVPPAVALQILKTVADRRSTEVKKELHEFLPDDAVTTSLGSENGLTAQPVSPSPQLFDTAMVTIKRPSPGLTGPVGVMQIEGRAAVDAKDLFPIVSGMAEKYYNQWFKACIVRFGFVVGKHYVEYSKPKGPGQKKPQPGYILNIDEAIAIADSAKQNAGKGVANYLIVYRKELAKLKLSTKGKLSDFIGMEPANVAPIETEPAEPVVEPTTEETSINKLWAAKASGMFETKNVFVAWLFTAQPGLDNGRPIELLSTDVGFKNVYNLLDRIEHGVLSPITHQSIQLNEILNHTAENPEGQETPQSGEISEGIFAQNGKKPEEAETPQSEEYSEAAEDNTPSDENPQPQPSGSESKDWVDPEDLPAEADSEAPNVFDLLVKFAQGQLQQAQALAKLYRDLAMTQGTISELVLIEQQAARQKLGLYPGTAVLPNVTLRDKINYAVRKRADATGEKYEDLFKAIYARLANDYGYSVLDLPRKKGQSHLNVCEELGIISLVWDIVNTAAFNQYLAKKSAA